MLKITRQRHGLGVRELARRAGVAPSAVTQWEQSEARGVLRPATLERALAVMGTSIAAEELSQHAPRRLERREDRAAQELHRAVAGRLIVDPDAVLALVPENARRLRARVRGGATTLLDVWEELAAEREIGRLVDVMLSTSARAIEMRQVSPFAGVLNDEERVRASSGPPREPRRARQARTERHQGPRVRRCAHQGVLDRSEASSRAVRCDQGREARGRSKSRGARVPAQLRRRRLILPVGSPRAHISAAPENLQSGAGVARAMRPSGTRRRPASRSARPRPWRGRTCRGRRGSSGGSRWSRRRSSSR